MAESVKRPGGTPEIGALYAFLAANETGDEGVVGIRTAKGMTQLITAMPSLIPVMRTAAEIALGSGEHLRVVRFVRAEVLGEFD